MTRAKIRAFEQEKKMEKVCTEIVFPNFLVRHLFASKMIVLIYYNHL